MAYQRNWKNTVIKVVSIIEIVISALAIISGIALMVSGFVVGSYGAAYMNEAVSVQGATPEAAAMTADIITQSGTAIGLGSIIVIVAASLELVAGILGVRGANDPSKITPFIVFTVIGILTSFVSVIVNIVSGTFAWTNLISIAMSAFLLYLAFSVRTEYATHRKYTRR